MRLKTCLIFSFFVLSLSRFASAMEPKDERLMGFEAETASIKVRTYGVETQFKFLESSNKHLLVTSDTPDETIEDGGWDNIEVKTQGGLSYSDIQKDAFITQSLLNYFRSKSLNTELILEKSSLPEGFLWIHKENSLKISSPDAKEHQKLKTIYPQITYQLPVENIPILFERLSEHGHPDIIDFLGKKKKKPESMPVDPKLNQTISQTKQNTELAAIFNKLAIAMKEKANQKIDLKAKFRGAIFDAWNNTSEKLKGFGMLLNFYIYQLFINFENIAYEEPGLKPVLPIMSRLSFSKMFNELNPQEKSSFVDITGQFPQDFKVLPIRKYKNSEDGEFIDDQNRIKLGDWLSSIVNGKDLLSPPPKMYNNYSMGTFKVEKNFPPNYALIEMRGYARLKDLPVTIDNFSDFVKNESKCFFEKEK